MILFPFQLADDAIMMDKVFPLKTYSGRQSRVLRPKPATETGQQLASEYASQNVFEGHYENTPWMQNTEIFFFQIM